MSRNYLTEQEIEEYVMYESIPSDADSVDDLEDETKLLGPNEIS